MGMVSDIILEDVRQIAGDIKDVAGRLAGRTLLISGGGGFIGSYFLDTVNYLNERILPKPCKVISVDNYITGSTDRLEHLKGNKNFKLIQHDIRNPLKVDGPVHFIVHAAGIASPLFYRKYPMETIEVHTLGTKNFLELARKKKVESFLFFSSSEIYGNPPDDKVPTPEAYRGDVSCTGPRACYDESKRLGETLCMCYYQLYNVPVKVVRPFNVYGPGMKLDDQRVIPNFLRGALLKRPLEVYDGGRHTRAFCYISDAVVEFFRVLLSDYNGDVFNVGSDELEISMEQLAHMVGEVFDGGVRIVSRDAPDVAYAKDNPSRRCPDIAKVRTLLKCEPKVGLREGLARLIEWYREEYKIPEIV
jgi:dTDP-glucose 4,6-dehydratase/UDP-glucuronate decarboxylase